MLSSGDVGVSSGLSRLSLTSVGIDNVKTITDSSTLIEARKRMDKLRRS